MDIYQQAQEDFQQFINKEISRRAERVKNLLTPEKSITVEQKQHLEIQLCQQNIDHWLKNWVWVYEPRPKPRTIPYTEAEFQKKVIKELSEAVLKGHDLRIEKSRDMRITWTVLIVFLYYWQFHDMTFLVGSRKAEEVDKMGDLDTLLPKVRFMIEKQLSFLLPKGFDKDQHMSWMNIQNPESKGSIAGESNNASFGTGGRRNAIFFDEFAKWEFTDGSAWISAGANTPSRIAVSTPKFKNNRFYLLLKEPVKNLTVHWSEDAVKAAGLVEADGKKTSPWYEEQKKRYLPDELAQEFDISYGGTQHSSVFHEELALMRLEQRIRPTEFMKELPIYWAFDPGTGSLWANGFYQVLGFSEEIRWFDYYENQNKGLEHYLEWVKSPERVWNKIYADKEAGGANYRLGWKSMVVVPDPNQGTNTEATSGKSLVSLLKIAGFERVVIRKIGKIEAISEAKRIFKHLVMDNGQFSQGMILALDRMQGYHYKFNEAFNEYAEEPVHDESSHCADQFKYFAGYIKNPEQMARVMERQKDQRDKQLTPQPARVAGMAGY